MSPSLKDWIIAALSATLVFSVGASLFNFLHRSLFPKSSRPEPILRRKVLEVIQDEEGGEILRLECGHHYKLVHHYPSQFPCAQCTGEVAELKKMAGQK